MSSERPIAEEEGAYPDRGKKDGDRAENSRGRCDHAQSFLRDIYRADGDIQRDGNTVLFLWLLGSVCHGQNARKVRRRDVVEDPET